MGVLTQPLDLHVPPLNRHVVPPASEKSDYRHRGGHLCLIVLTELVEGQDQRFCFNSALVVTGWDSGRPHAESDARLPNGVLARPKRRPGYCAD